MVANICSAHVLHCCHDCRFLFKYRGSVVPKAAMWAFPAAALAFVLHYMQNELNMKMAHLPNESSSKVWSGFTWVIGALMVFRTNQAYSRYWEGATLLQQVRGEWFNATSSLFAFCTDAKERAAEVEKFQHMLVRLMSMLYCAGLQQVALVPEDQLEIIDTSGMDPLSLEFLKHSNDRCEVVLQWVQRAIVENLQNGVINIAPPILSRVFQELSRGIVNLQNARKIAEVPFPFPYTQLILGLLYLHTIVTPVLASMSSPTAWWSCLQTFIVTLAYWCMNYIAAEIEQPFGEEYNDLPIAEYLKDMNGSLRMLLKDQVQVTPRFEFCRPRDLNCQSVNCVDAKYHDIHQGVGRRQSTGFAKSRLHTIAKLLEIKSKSLSSTSFHHVQSDASKSAPRALSSDGSSLDSDLKSPPDMSVQQCHSSEGVELGKCNQKAKPPEQAHGSARPPSPRTKTHSLSFSVTIQPLTGISEQEPSLDSPKNEGNKLHGLKAPPLQHGETLRQSTDAGPRRSGRRSPRVRNLAQPPSREQPQLCLETEPK